MPSTRHSFKSRCKNEQHNDWLLLQASCEIIPKSLLVRESGILVWPKHNTAWQPKETELKRRPDKQLSRFSTHLSGHLAETRLSGERAITHHFSLLNVRGKRVTLKKVTGEFRTAVCECISDINLWFVVVFSMKERLANTGDDIDGREHMANTLENHFSTLEKTLLNMQLRLNKLIQQWRWFISPPLFEMYLYVKGLYSTECGKTYTSILVMMMLLEYPSYVSCKWTPYPSCQKPGYNLFRIKTKVTLNTRVSMNM